MGKIKDMFLKYEEMKDDLKFLQDNEGSKDDIEYQQIEISAYERQYKNLLFPKPLEEIKAKTSVIDVDATTGEITISANNQDHRMIKEVKIKALSLLKSDDFVSINGVWEAKRDGLIKILSSLPISYSWQIRENVIEKGYAKVRGVLCISTGDISRSSDGIGICEHSELKGNGGLHFMNARAETRALKRAIEVLFGSVINYFVIHYLEQRRAA